MANGDFDTSELDLAMQASLTSFEEEQRRPTKQQKEVDTIGLGVTIGSVWYYFVFECKHKPDELIVQLGMLDTVYFDTDNLTVTDLLHDVYDFVRGGDQSTIDAVRTLVQMWQTKYSTDELVGIFEEVFGKQTSREVFDEVRSVDQAVIYLC